MNRIQELSEKHYEEIFSLSQFAFQYELSEEVLLKKKEEVERHTVWGIMDNDRIAAKLHLIPLSVKINGSEFEMGGISSVATWPEYRRKGMVKDLLFHALQYMKEQGQCLSYLHPFSVPFYRQYGWEVAFAKKSYEIPMEKLKKKWDGNGYVRRGKADVPLLHTIYSEYIKRFNGPLTRDEKWWKQRVLNDKSIIAVAYNEEHQPEGYLLYHVKDNVLKVDELAYCSTNGLKILLQFISNHDSMAEKIEMVVPENDKVPLLIDEPRFKQKVEPYFMARIVDVLSFLKQYMNQISSDSFSLNMFVHDSFLTENTGVYTLNQFEGKGYVTYSSSVEEKEAVINCNVQQLTSMLLGYQRPIDLYELGMVDGDANDIEKLEEIIPRKQTYFPDFF